MTLTLFVAVVAAAVVLVAIVLVVVVLRLRALDRQLRSVERAVVYGEEPLPPPSQLRRRRRRSQGLPLMVGLGVPSVALRPRLAAALASVAALVVAAASFTPTGEEMTDEWPMPERVERHEHAAPRARTVPSAPVMGVTSPTTTTTVVPRPELTAPVESSTTTTAAPVMTTTTAPPATTTTIPSTTTTSEPEPDPEHRYPGVELDVDLGLAGLSLDVGVVVAAE